MLKRTARALAGWLVFLAFHPFPALAQDFGAFDPRRIPIELQAWWAPNFGHIHAAARLPIGQTVSGRLEFDARIILHNNPSHLKELSFHTDRGSFLRMPLDLDCPYDGVTPNTCAFNVPVTIDTRELRDGWREIRMRAITETPDGQRFFNSSGIPLNVQNGGSDSDYDRFCDNRSLIGRGWYEGFDYTNAIIECVPLAPVSGVHTFGVRAQHDSGRLTVALDKTHHVPPVGNWPEQPMSAGEILFDEEGEFTKFFDITLDTRRLADGWHSLAVKSTHPDGEPSDCDFCDGEINRAAGVAKMWFYVDNGVGDDEPSDPTTTTTTTSTTSLPFVDPTTTTTTTISTVPTTSTTTSTTTTVPGPSGSDTCGDVDADGEVTVVDALIALVFLLGDGVCDLDRCDPTNDGLLTVEDVLEILKAAAELEATLDCPQIQ